ncbi:MAG: nuclear transport factor 2 family protein [Gammaproteobacteria bacterium]|nr:nuclear transport factor 2 family protein [Gammaproteobacteria bacterium]NNJ51368.1 SnoaL-like domain-containing protein [Gammaproteobacteria bacterium]
MKKTKLQLQTPDEVDAVFYEAFMRCDADVMAALWADEDVVCVHPGAGVILEYEAIIRSWANIFNNVDAAEINTTLINSVLSDDMAVYVVAEEMLNSGQVAAVVLATNVYRKFDCGWLMVEHHASLVQNQPAGQTLQ